MDNHEQAPEESQQDERVDILNLNGWQILEEHEQAHLYRFTAKVTAPISACLLCGVAIAPYRFGIREHTYADLPMHGKHVQIKAVLQRYRCRVCHKTFLDPTPQMSEQHFATVRLV